MPNDSVTPRSARRRVGLKEEAAEQIHRPVLDRDVGDQVGMRCRDGSLRGDFGGGGSDTLDGLRCTHD